VGVLHHEGDLGLGRVGAEPLVAADRQDARAVDQDERLPVAVVDVDEAFEITLGNARVRREVA
jgi:hypothetical protein